METIKYFTRQDIKEEEYLGSKIIALRLYFEEWNDKKNIWEQKKEVYCHLYSPNIKYQPLNLGECNNGDKFSSVNQAVNQAKGIVNSVINYRKTN